MNAIKQNKERRQKKQPKTKGRRRTKTIRKKERERKINMEERYLDDPHSRSSFWIREVVSLFSL